MSQCRRGKKNKKRSDFCSRNVGAQPQSNELCKSHNAVNTFEMFLSDVHFTIVKVYTMASSIIQFQLGVFLEFNGRSYMI